MNDEAVFENLFAKAVESKDPKGVVAACLVLNGRILSSAVSSDDGKTHAENILLSSANDIDDDTILYTTVEPCSKRTDPSMTDCVSILVRAGIKHVVYGARDPKQTEETMRRCREAGIELSQVENPAIIEKSALLFNQTIRTEGVDLKPLH